jgi:ribonuclease HI
MELQIAREESFTHITVESDSKLVIYTVTERYKLNENIFILAQQMQYLANLQ